jgi:hypothetical protein
MPKNQSNKPAASPGYKTPNEKFNAEFAEETNATLKKKVKDSQNAASNHTSQIQQ